jgi:hypothetical protein
VVRSEESGTEEGEEHGGNESNPCIKLSSDSKHRIDCIPSINIHSNGFLSVKYLIWRLISGAPEYEPICIVYIPATERVHS